MNTLNVKDAFSNFNLLIEQINETHEPVLINGATQNAVLLSENDWKSIQETLYLLSIPGLRDSLIEGMKEPLNESTKELNW